jgi:hypothetical protein
LTNDAGWPSQRRLDDRQTIGDDVAAVTEHVVVNVPRPSAGLHFDFCYDFEEMIGMIAKGVLHL